MRARYVLVFRSLCDEGTLLEQGEGDHRNNPWDVVGDEDHLAGDLAPRDRLLGWRLRAHLMAQRPDPCHQQLE